MSQIIIVYNDEVLKIKGIKSFMIVFEEVSICYYEWKG